MFVSRSSKDISFQCGDGALAMLGKRPHMGCPQGPRVVASISHHGTHEVLRHKAFHDLKEVLRALRLSKAYNMLSKGSQEALKGFQETFKAL